MFKTRILVVAAIISYGTLQAQTGNEQNLDEVVVTATRKEQKQSQTGKVVTVIDQGVLQKNSGRSLTEILNQYAGIYIAGANSAPGSNQELYLRGAATGNSLILLDGIPLQDPSNITNAYDLNNIQPDQIEKIEILKGAQSTIWGSNAVAGVINIITKKGGPKKITPSAGLSYGSYQTWKGNLGLSGNINKFSYNLAYNHISTDGFSAAHDSLGSQSFDNDGLTQNAFQAHLNYKFTNKLSANFTSNYGHYKADGDAGAFIDDRDYTLSNKHFVNSLGIHYNTGKTAIHLVQSMVNADRIFTDDSTDVGGLRLDPAASFYSKWSEGNYKGRSMITDLYGNQTLSSNISLVGGLQYIHQKTDQDYRSISNYGPYDGIPVSGDSANTGNFAVYASFLLTDWHGLNLELGGRFNNHSIYGNNTTFTFNPSYNISEQTRIFVNISSGFNTPSLYQLYSEYGNKELKPEKSTNYELGVQSLTNDNRNSFRIVAFKRDIEDLITFYTDPNTYASWYINRDQQHDYGFEVESNMSLGQLGQWISNFTYVTGEGNSEGVKLNNLYHRPEFAVNSTIQLTPLKNLVLAPAFKYIGSRLAGPYDLGENPMKPYYTIDIYASYTVCKNAKLFADFRNITNQQYFDTYGYNNRRANFMFGFNIGL